MKFQIHRMTSLGSFDQIAACPQRLGLVGGSWSNYQG